MLPDIVYDRNSGMWKCCSFSNGTLDSRDCQNPTKETFSAPAPGDLITYWTAGAIATASQKQSAEPTSSSIGSLTATSTTTNSKISSVPISTDSGGSSLSTVAVAGIIVSSIISSVALILVIAISMHNKRRLNRRFEEKDYIVNPKISQNSKDQKQQLELSIVHVPKL
jgi:hypothetical protein